MDKSYADSEARVEDLLIAMIIEYTWAEQYALGVVQNPSPEEDHPSHKGTLTHWDAAKRSVE